MRRLCGSASTLLTCRILFVVFLVVAGYLLYSSWSELESDRRWISPSGGGNDGGRTSTGAELFSPDQFQQSQRCRCEEECSHCAVRVASKVAVESLDGGASLSERDVDRNEDPGGSRAADGGGTAGGGCPTAQMSVNGEYTQTVFLQQAHPSESARSPGKRAKTSILWPFSFVKKYCDIPGAAEIRKGGVVFEHSHGRLYNPTPSEPYRSVGPYITFENSSVEMRGQVKCVDGIESVPRSQRDDRANSYFYPTQIAQYGLKHYSKLTSQGGEEDGAWIVLDDGTGSARSRWRVSGGKIDYGDGEMRFNTDGFRQGVGVEAGIHTDTTSLRSPDKSTRHHPPVLVLTARLQARAAVTVRLQALFHEQKSLSAAVYTMHYVTELAGPPKVPRPVDCAKPSSDIVYQLGDDPAWRTVVRDLGVDVMKGIAVCRGVKLKSGLSRDTVLSVRVLSVQLHGSGRVRALSLNSSAHEQMFLNAAKWFVAQQDESGAWPIPVKRHMSIGVAALMPGWKSAMAQGQAISLLVRTYHHTKEDVYLDAALKAVDPYRHLSKDGGVRAVFMAAHPWYEEYPTSPPTFVLNGFISAILGLHDLAQVVATVRGRAAAREAQELFDDGFRSLHALLPLYDTGSGSVYDLRHFTTRQAPNVVRAEYHVTHLNQLAALCSVFPTDDELRAVHRRWAGYHRGHRAKRN